MAKLDHTKALRERQLASASVLWPEPALPDAGRAKTAAAGWRPQGNKTVGVGSESLKGATMYLGKKLGE